MPLVSLELAYTIGPVKHKMSAYNWAFFLIHQFKHVFCDGSFEYPQHMIWLRNKKTIFSYALLFGNLLHRKMPMIVWTFLSRLSCKFHYVSCWLNNYSTVSECVSSQDCGPGIRCDGGSCVCLNTQCFVESSVALPGCESFCQCDITSGTWQLHYCNVPYLFDETTNSCSIDNTMDIALCASGKIKMLLIRHRCWILYALCNLL